MSTFRKIVQGETNHVHETSSIHQRMTFYSDASLALTVATFYLLLMVTVIIVFMVITHREMVEWIVTISVVLGCAYACYWLVQKARRDYSSTQTQLTLNYYRQQQAALEARIAVQAEAYVAYEDEEGYIRFCPTVSIVENRHYPQLEAPQPEPDVTDYVLAAWDGGMTGRKIWEELNKSLKERGEKVSYEKIGKILDKHRYGWRDVNRKGGTTPLPPTKGRKAKSEAKAKEELQEEAEEE